MTALGTVAGARVRTRSRRRGRAWKYYLAISPFFILFAVFGIYPLIYSLILSFQKWNGLGPTTWVGIANYQQLLADDTFWLSLRNTLTIFVLSTVPMLVLALVIAGMLNAAVRYTTIYRIAFFIPNITSVVAMAVLFGSIFGERFGLANAVLTSIGLPAVGWLTTPFGIQITIALLITYQWTGYNAIIFLAGMQSISGEVYEAAKIDGAGAIRSFISITLPLLRPTILFVLVVSTITGLQSFTEAQVLTASGSTQAPNNGGSGQGGLTTVLYFYQQAFSYNRFGYGAAIAWAVFVIVVLLSVLTFRASSERREKTGTR